MIERIDETCRQREAEAHEGTAAGRRAWPYSERGNGERRRGAAWACREGERRGAIAEQQLGRGLDGEGGEQAAQRLPTRLVAVVGRVLVTRRGRRRPLTLRQALAHLLANLLQLRRRQRVKRLLHRRIGDAAGELAREQLLLLW